MKIRSTGGEDYELVPEGLQAAVCTHCVELGLQETPWGAKEKMALVFELDARMSDGRPFMQSKIYTASTNEKSNFRKDLNTWRGKALSDEEADGFDTDNLINKGAYLNIVHNTKDGKTWSNIGGIMKVPAGIKVPKPTNQDIPDWLKKMRDSGIARMNAEAAASGPAVMAEKPAQTAQQVDDSDLLPF